MPSLAGKRRLGTEDSEVLFASDPAESRRLQRAAAKGRITRIAPGVYIPVPPDDPESAIVNLSRKHSLIASTLFSIASRYI